MNAKDDEENANSDSGDAPAKPQKWSFGVLNDRETDEVPGECRRSSTKKSSF
jgi:hypothetical protein